MMNKSTVYFSIQAFIILLLFAVANVRDGAESDKGRAIKNCKLHSTILEMNYSADQENHAPVIKINSPKSGDLYEWNTTAQYTISVSDKEDGDSKYEEITPNEVFLEVRYVKDATKIPALLKLPVKKDAAGITVIKTSNCLNCHAFHTSLIGPSFYEISKRYTATENQVELLAKRIREGSSGVWGKVSMPAHPELSVQQTRDVVKWILVNAGKPDMDYFTGTEGSFRIQPPASIKNKGFLLLTSSYTDHGVKDKPNTSLKSQDKIVLKIR